jgi:hypothetical protein
MIQAAGGSNEPPKIVLASDILANISNGKPVECDHVIVKGDLNLSRLNLSTDLVEITQDERNFLGLSGNTVLSNNVSTIIKIRNSTIDGNVSFNNTIFGIIDFMNTNFNRSANFSLSRFNEDARFSYSKFNGVADFRTSKFKKTAKFQESRFNGKADFGAAKFIEFAYFDNSKFREPAFFEFSKFTGPVSFSDSKFNRTAYFENSTFAGPAYFDRSEFSGDAHFYGSQFDGSASFSDSKFNGIVSFEYSKFKGYADFWESEVNGDAKFRGAEFYKKLDLGFSSFHSIQIEWNSIKDISWEEPTTQKLIKNFKDLGQDEAADNVYYSYRRLKQDRASWFDLSKYLDIFALASCGYGVKWLNTVISGVVVLIIFGLVYFLMISRSNSNKADFTQLKDSFWFSAIVLLSVPSELYPQKTDTYKEYANKIKYHLPILERLIGWGLLILFISTLSRVMIRY